MGERAVELPPVGAVKAERLQVGAETLQQGKFGRRQVRQQLLHNKELYFLGHSKRGSSSPVGG
jgi:hypothetical protein